MFKLQNSNSCIILVIASPVMSATTGNVPVFTFAVVLIFDETFWYLWHYVLVQQRPNVLITIIILLALLVHCHVTRVASMCCAQKIYLSGM